MKNESMEKYLTSLAKSKKLKETGVKQESEFTYYNNGGDWSEFDLDKNDRKEYMGYAKSCDRVSAFSISELLEMVSNDDLFAFNDLKDPDGNYTYVLLNIIRNPDRLADVVLWKVKREKVK